MEQWMEKIEKEKITSGQGLPIGETVINFKDILDYERVDEEFQGRPTTKFLVKFKNGSSVFLPKTVFKDLKDALEDGAFGLKVVRSGQGINTKYATVPITQIKA